MRWEKHVDKPPVPNNGILIYGVGKIGFALVSCLQKGHCVGFIDDDPAINGARIRRLRVYGRESDIPIICKVHPFNELWVTFRPSATKRERLGAICERNNIRLHILPEIQPFSGLKQGWYLKAGQDGV